jgi:hypothetical protein
MPELIIDAWMQFPDESFLRDLMFESLRRWPTHWRTLAEQNAVITADEALNELRRQGSTKVVASAWWGHEASCSTRMSALATTEHSTLDPRPIACGVTSSIA